MTEPEKLKNTLSSIFSRKGANGRYTRIFDDLEATQQRFLLDKVQLNPDELAIIGSAEGSETWFLLTTQRIVWRLRGRDEMLALHEVLHAKADFPKMANAGIQKSELRELQIETATRASVSLEVEEGAPLSGLWNVLLNLGARNRQKK
jgi:hypothetical protein